MRMETHQYMSHHWFNLLKIFLGISFRQIDRCLALNPRNKEGILGSAIGVWPNWIETGSNSREANRSRL